MCDIRKTSGFLIKISTWKVVGFISLCHGYLCSLAILIRLISHSVGNRYFKSTLICNMSKIRRIFNKILIKKIVPSICRIYNDCNKVTLRNKGTFLLETCKCSASSSLRVSS